MGFPCNFTHAALSCQVKLWFFFSYIAETIVNVLDFKKDVGLWHGILTVSKPSSCLKVSLWKCVQHLQSLFSHCKHRNLVLGVIMSTQPVYCHSTVKTAGLRKTVYIPIYWGNSYKNGIFKAHSNLVSFEGFLLMLPVPYLSRSLSHSLQNVLTGFLRVGKFALRLFAREKKDFRLGLKMKLYHTLWTDVHLIISATCKVITELAVGTLGEKWP